MLKESGPVDLESAGAKKHDAKKDLDPLEQVDRLVQGAQFAAEKLTEQVELVRRFKEVKKWEVLGEIKRLQEGGSSDSSIALALIDSGRGFFLAKHLNEFPSLNHHDVALNLINSGDGRGLMMHLENFKLDDYKEIVLKLYEAGFDFQIEGKADKLESLGITKEDLNRFKEIVQKQKKLSADRKAEKKHQEYVRDWGRRNKPDSEILF